MIINKKFKQGLWIILILLLVVIACQRLTSKSNETKTAMPKIELPFHERQRTDFSFLEKGISYEEIVAHLGKEDRDIGSGLYILEYNLIDGSKIYMQFRSLKSLDTASIVYVDGRAEDIIGP
jgi:hypothetical protein